MPQSQYADLDYSGYHKFTDEDNGDFGSFEVFTGRKYYDKINAIIDEIDLDCYYYWPCFPGCLPDSDPIGPFDTSAEAYHDAQGF